MLVLGRKPGEFIKIGESIIVKVIRSEQGDLRLAIDAPREMNIVRGEVYESQQRVLRENESKESGISFKQEQLF